MAARATLHSAIRLDEDQLAVVLHPHGTPARCLAGPGSGKTFTLASRVAHLLQSGEPTSRILCVTFSVAAAKEMRSRVVMLTGRKDLPSSMFSTFHALGLRIISAERDLLPWKPQSDMVAEPRKAKEILRYVIDEIHNVFARDDRDDHVPPLGIRDPRAAQALRNYVAKIRDAREYSDVYRTIGLLRRELRQPKDVDAEDPMRYIYAAFDRAMQRIGLVDFEGMVYWAVLQIVNFPQSASRWRGRYKYVLIDEAHDMSRDQERLAELVADPGGIMLFGDPSQSIYGFRGADPEILHRWDRQTYVLGRNYRSTRGIVESFRRLAEDTPLAQAMRALRDGGSVQKLTFPTDEEEVEWTIAAIEKEHALGTPWNQIAVLSRTRARLEPYISALSERGIPYSWRGKNFWQSPEVKSAVAWIRLAANPSDKSALRDVILSKTPLTKYMGRKFADIVCSAESMPDADYVEQKTNHATAARWSSLRNAIMELHSAARQNDVSHVAENICWLLSSEDDGNDPDSFAKENLEHLARIAQQCRTVEELLERARIGMKSHDHGVMLSTIHAAKGLEWDVVFVVCVSDGILPHRCADDKDEERRILYVALSRAREKLYVSHCERAGKFWWLISTQET